MKQSLPSRYKFNLFHQARKVDSKQHVKKRQVIVEEDKLDENKPLVHKRRLDRKERQWAIAIRILLCFQSNVDEPEQSETVLRLKEDWKKGDYGLLNMQQFVDVMVQLMIDNAEKLIDAPQLTDKEKISALIEIYEDIDFNDQKKIEFEEFVNFLINAAKITNYGPSWYKKYRFKRVIDSSNSEESVKRICFFPNWGKIVTCGRTKKCKIINPKDYKTEHVLPDHEGTILNAEYVEDHNLLVTSSADLCVRFWDENSNFDCVHDHTCNITGSQTVLRYSPHHKVLFGGSRTGQLSFWRWVEVKGEADHENVSPLEPNPEKKEMFQMNEKQSQKLHTNVITDMLFLPHENKLVSCSQDSLIKFSDLEKLNGDEGYQVLKATNLTGHKRGVFNLAWSADYHFLISSGFEYEALVWVANISTTNPFKLRDQRRPHQHSLVGVQAVPNTPQVITADAKGMIKIWDIRTFQCMQTLYTENTSTSKNHDFGNYALSSFVFVDDPYKHIVTTGRKISIFEYERTANPTFADDQPIIYCQYNLLAQSFVTASAKSLKIWDAISGTVSRIYENISSSEITSLALDDTGRKIFVGTHDGEIRVLQFSNGEFIKKYVISTKGKKSKTSTVENGVSSSKSSDKEITSLVYCTQQRALIATSWNRGVFLLSDREIHYGSILKDFSDSNHYHTSDVRCSDYSEAYSCAITGDDEAKILVWDLQNMSKVGECVNPAKQRLFSSLHSGQVMRGAITVLKFLGTYPAFVCADSTGFLHLWTIGQFAYPFCKICSWRNYNPNRKVTPSVTVLEFHVENNYLYTGDDQGYICVWDLDPIFKSSNLKPKRFENSQYVNRSTGENSQPSFPLDSVPKQFDWSTKQDSIRSIQIVYNPSCLITANYCGNVSIWAFDGTLIDTLQQEPFSSEPFKFPIDESSKLKTHSLEVGQIISDIHEKLTLLTKWREKAVPKKESEEDSTPFITEKKL